MHGRNIDDFVLVVVVLERSYLLKSGLQVVLSLSINFRDGLELVSSRSYFHFLFWFKSRM